MRPDKENVTFSQDRAHRFSEFIKETGLGVTSYSGRMKDPWQDITFPAAQLTKPPIDSHKEHIDLSLNFGGRYSPSVKTDLPIMVAGMSYGALSYNAKLAIHKALNTLAREHGMKIFYNTGEGGVLPHEIDDRDYLLMIQVASGRFNVQLDSLAKADAIEIKIGQGAKPGIGGQLPASKVTEEIAYLRKIPAGIPAYSPARNMDIIGPEDLFAKIQELRIATRSKVPIGVKIAAGNTYHDAIIASRLSDFVTLDGMSGGTGASPEIAQSYLGVQTIPSIVEARNGIDAMVTNLYKTLRRIDRAVDFEDVTLISSGGIIFPNEIYAALSLGSTMVSVGTGVQLALGCIACFNCHTKCPENVTTNNGRSKDRGAMDIDAMADNIVRYFLNAKEGLELFYSASGHYLGNGTTILDLRTTNSEIHETTGIPMPGNKVNTHAHAYVINDYSGCGIAAIIPSEKKLEEIMNEKAKPLPVNILLKDMLNAEQVRGPDSAGFAFYYNNGVDNHHSLKLRFNQADQPKVEEIIRKNCGHILAIEDSTPDNYERGFKIIKFNVRTQEDKSLSALDELSEINDLTLLSFGRFSDVIKDVGSVKRVSNLYHIDEYKNILYGLGHVRTATMSSVNPVTAHPFSTAALPDITVVHNGEITNAPKLKKRFKVMGYPFFAPTDSEVIATYVAERMIHGYSLNEACRDFVNKGDGPYTFLLAAPQGIAFVKDRYGLRPAMSAFNPNLGFYAVATDINALNRVGATEEKDMLSTGGVKIFPVTRR